MKTKILPVHLTLSICWLSVVTCLLSCDRDDVLEEPEASRQGEIRPVGEPLGDAEDFAVDQNGGTVASADGLITLHFPAGAVSSATTVTIQKVVNTTPNGMGDAYRLTPHADFASPVTIVIKYSSDSISLPDALGMAYQDETGVWNAVQIHEHDKEAQTISVQTTHFSDWSLFESVRISPAFSVVAPGDQVLLKATAVLKNQELLTPLTEGSTPLASTALDPAYVSMWNLEGPGTLVPGGSTARYTATADYGNQVKVTLSLNIPGAPAAVARAKIVIGGSYVTFAGGPYETLTVHGFAAAVYAAQTKSTLIQFTAKVNNEDYWLAIHYPASGAGTIAWMMKKDKECHVQSLHKFPGGSITGTVADPDSKDSHHQGSVTVDSYQDVGKYITGSFQGGFSYIPNDCVSCMIKGSISGTFFAKRYL